jgi:MFS family permease
VSAVRQPSPAARTGLLPRVVSFVVAGVAFLTVFFAASAPSPFLALYEQQWRFAVWLETLAFGIYALALLAALLFFGVLSDVIGRRPVVVAALLVLVAAMVVLMLASDVGWLIAGRVIQGFGTGLAVGAVSASVVELAPPRYHGLGVLAAAVLPLTGQALGGIVTGSVITAVAHPAYAVFGTLAAILLVGAVLVTLGHETVPRRAGALRALIPRVAVPRTSRGAFAAAIPVLLTTWMIGGFYLGILPVAVGPRFHVGSFVTGVALTILNASGVIATLAARRLTASTNAIVGEIVVFVGVAGLATSLVTGSVVLLMVATCVTGAAFGMAFAGALGTVLPTAGARERSGLISAVYIVSYIAFGVPAIVAGVIAGAAGVLPTAVAYGLIVMAIAVVGLAVQLRRRPAAAREAAAARGVETASDTDDDTVQQGLL